MCLFSLTWIDVTNLYDLDLLSPYRSARYLSEVLCACEWVRVYDEMSPREQSTGAISRYFIMLRSFYTSTSSSSSGAKGKSASRPSNH